MAFSSQRVEWVVAVLAIVAILLVAAVLSFTLFPMYWPSGAEEDGIFRIKTKTATGFGHRHTIATLYAKRRKLGSNLESYRKNPYNPAQVLFTTYDWGGKPGGTFFYDDATQRLVRLGPNWYIDDPEPKRLWAPGGRLTVITALEDVRALNTTTCHVEHLARTLFADGRQRNLTFVGWSPNGTRLAIVVNGVRGEPSAAGQDLLEIDTRTWRPRYVATMSDRPRGTDWCWQPSEMKWRPTPAGYLLQPAAAPRDGARVVVKPAAPPYLAKAD